MKYSWRPSLRTFICSILYESNCWGVDPTQKYGKNIKSPTQDCIDFAKKINNLITLTYNLTNPYYNLPYNQSAPFVCSGFLVSYRIRSAMKFPQDVLHYIWHTSMVYVIYIKSLSRYIQLTRNWTDKAKWRSIEASNNINKHTGHWLLAVDWPPNKFRFS